MKFQVEFLEIRKGIQSAICVDPKDIEYICLMYADKVCAGLITRNEAVRQALRTINEEDFTHYHGSPMWGNVDIGGGSKVWCGDVLYRDACALVSYAHIKYKQTDKILKLCKSLILDCGAFTFYMRGVKADFSFWIGYFDYVFKYLDKIDWFIIPDVIGGTEAENDALIDSVPPIIAWKGVPVWHSDESLERLSRLCDRYDRVAVGLIKEHKPAHGVKATEILTTVFKHLYYDNDYKTKIHGLAMLDGRVLSRFPFDSADSTFVATNVPKLKKQIPEVTCKLARTAIYKNKVEMIKTPSIPTWISNNAKLFKPRRKNVFITLPKKDKTF